MAALGPAASATLANDLHQDPPITWNATGFGGGDDCKDVGAGDVLWHFVQTQVSDNISSGKLTAEFDDAGVVTVDSYKKSGGVLHWAITTGHDTLLSAESDVDSDGNLNLSHICVGPEESEAPSEEPSEAPSEEPSEAPSEEPSEAPSEEPSEAPSEEPSEAPSETPSDTPSEEPSTPPSGGVEGATGTPKVTPPATDTEIGPSSAPSNDAWRLVLIAMAGLLAAILVLTPATKPVRRD